ncbi:MAG: hypothetical protein GYA31_00415 [Parcubacteria group bacterium]|nr:hypothetical protein [Parcubacteria group bacterium]
MPENYFAPNQSPTPSQSEPTPVPSEPEPKFSPPSPNIFIRTSESDLEKMKSGGGEVPPWQAPPTPPPAEPQPPVNEYPSFASNPPQEETLSNEPAFNPNISATEFTNFPAPQVPKKNNKLIPIIIIIGIIIAGAVLGYFVLWPKLFASKTTTTTTTTVAETPTTTVTTLPPSPFPQISGPYQKTLVDLKLSGNLVLSTLKEAATKEMAPSQTFSILIPKYQSYSLSSEEVVLSLIPNMPESLKPYLLGRKFLTYVYYGDVNPSLGLIIDVGANTITDIKAIFANWEKGKILTDLSNFWLIKVPKTTNKTFKDTTTNGAEIRYFPYSGKEAAISYGFYNDYLIISSSLESINSAVTHLQGATEPIYP